MKVENAVPRKHQRSRWLRNWTSRRATTAFLAAATAAVLSMLAINTMNPLVEGLAGQYFAAASEPPVLTRIDALPSAVTILDGWRGSPPNTFVVTWNGTIVIPRDGTYTFGIDTAQHGSLSIDGRVVVDNTQTGAVHLIIGDAALSKGSHALFVQYVHRQGPVHMDLLWGPSGGTLAPLPADRLHPRRLRAFTEALGASARFLLNVSEWAWASALFVALLAWAASCAGGIWHALDDNLERTALRWIVCGSLVLNVTGLWWGLPEHWAPDELTSGTVRDALARHFSHGWYDRWPPLHYYTLTLATSPLLSLHAMGRINAAAGPWPALLTAMSRAVSIAAGAGTLVALAVTGTRVFGPRAGTWAAVVFALATPFVYYAKTANLDVPYVFWFAVSLVFYLAALQAGRRRDFVLFAGAATLAICTKDQAYALYALVPFVVLYRLRQMGRPRGIPWWRVVLDGRIVAATLTAAVIFSVCHNLVFNVGGFVEHVRYITGPGNENYRVFPPTLGGRLALLWLTGHLVKISWGWPLTLIASAGLLMALFDPRRRAITVWILCPVVSYYFGFINVILYNYDRFVLPMCYVLALFAGLALDTFLAAGGGRWRTVAVGGAIAYTLLYTSTLDVLMIRDSRHAVAQWMQATLGADDLVGVSGPSELQPALNCHCEEISSLALLAEQRPAYYILSADYAHAVQSNTEWGQLIAGLERESAGYRLVARFRTASPWPWLPDAHPDLVGPRTVNNDPNESDPFRIAHAGAFSILRNVNPTIEIFRREGVGTPR